MKNKKRLKGYFDWLEQHFINNPQVNFEIQKNVLKIMKVKTNIYTNTCIYQIRYRHT